ncbi:RNA-binding KH domain-containing protein RCF3-like isoform X1 [Zingiber officinale]|uniref:RNA-binding KH domain-containing protein RCF3-like isoform X1 n=1 Tax=Zingiber officinale TaxID=94328 RepID=UPI001C4C2C4E|nr:RNA-binding KH domain-containing protein RCF3-like isoform X1 [Zingiber officinale]
MERSRSKRSYHHDLDAHSPSPPPRSKSRYDGGSGGHHRRGNHYRRSGDRRGPPPPPPLPPPPPPPPTLPSSSTLSPSPKLQDGPHSAATVTTFFRILCPDTKAGGVIGKYGSIIKAFRQETGAWINVHQLVPGDDERIIETLDDRRKELDGRPPQYSPAEDALRMIHERIVDAEFEFGDGNEDEAYGSGGAGWGGGDRDRGRITTRLVVPRTHVGCLLGRGGKIIEQMRMETNTHIRILPRDQYTPRCVTVAEEVVQIVGEGNCVKKAVAIVLSRLKESLHRDRGPSRGRTYSPERYDEFVSNTPHLSGAEESLLASRSSAGLDRSRNNSYALDHHGYSFDSDANHVNDQSQTLSFEELVFRILCPNDKVERIIGLSSGIIEMLQADVGVDVQVSDPVPGSDECIITITSDEGSDADLFPAQEALLHIQTKIVDLGPDKDNVITTRLLVPTCEIISLEGFDGLLSDIQRLTSANIQILPKEDLPTCAMEADELVQIVGEIREARNALIQVTAKLRDYLYQDNSAPKSTLPLSFAAPSHAGIIAGKECNSPAKASPHESYQGSDPQTEIQNMHVVIGTRHSKYDTGFPSVSDQKESNASDEGRQSGVRRFNVPLVTKSTLEVTIPDQAVPSLIMRSGNKLAQISEMSGASITVIEDRPEQSGKIVQISGSPEQAEKAQSLLMGFILSTLPLWYLQRWLCSFALPSCGCSPQMCRCSRYKGNPRHLEMAHTCTEASQIWEVFKVIDGVLLYIGVFLVFY